MSLFRLSLTLAAINGLAIALISSWAHAQTPAQSASPAPAAVTAVAPQTVEKARRKSRAPAPAPEVAPAPPSPPTPYTGPALATDRVISRAIEPLSVSSPAFAAGGSIPDLYTRYGKSLSPPIAWSGAPPETRAYVLVVEDPDTQQAEPILHWLAYNIPGDRTELPRNVRNRAEPKNIPGMVQGLNSAGGVGWVGPHPPVGDPPHHYHFQVFALDRPLRGLGGKEGLDKLVAAMADRVLAEGELIGVYQAPAPAPVPASPPAAAPPSPTPPGR